MRKKALARAAATVVLSDTKKAMEILYQHAKYDAAQFRRANITSEEYEDLIFYVEEAFNCLELRVNGIDELWIIDKIIRDHDETSRDSYSVLLSIRQSFRQPGDEQEYTYNRYVYFRYFPAMAGLRVVPSIVPVQAIAHGTSDTNPRWTRAVTLLED